MIVECIPGVKHFLCLFDLFFPKKRLLSGWRKGLIRRNSSTSMYWKRQKMAHVNVYSCVRWPLAVVCVSLSSLQKGERGEGEWRREGLGVRVAESEK